MDNNVSERKFYILTKITILEKIQLLFSKKHKYFVEHTNKEITFKTIGDKIYIVKEKIIGDGSNE